MTTYRCVKPTCVLILMCLQIVYAFGIDRDGRIGGETNLGGERIYDEVKERVRRGVVPAEQGQVGAAGGAGALGGAGAPPAVPMVPGRDRGGVGQDFQQQQQMQMRGAFQQGQEALGQGLQRGVAPLNQFQGPGLQAGVGAGIRDRGMLNNDLAVGGGGYRRGADVNNNNMAQMQRQRGRQWSPRLRWSNPLVTL